MDLSLLLISFDRSNSAYMNPSSWFSGAWSFQLLESRDPCDTFPLCSREINKELISEYCETTLMVVEKYQAKLIPAKFPLNPTQ